MEWAQFLRADYWLTGAPGLVHAMTASVALVLGPLALLRKPRGDLIHRAPGLLFVAAMLGVNVTALSMYESSGGWTIFHSLAIASLASLVPGFRTARLFALTKDRNYLIAHATFMAWAYTGVVGAGVAQLATRIIPALWGDDVRIVVLALYFTATFALTALSTHRFAQRTKARAQTSGALPDRGSGEDHASLSP